jgi:glutamate-1-semialdehyde 2,1-aminomutase
MQRAHSNELFATAQTFFPGGVNSPVRAFGSVGGDPICIDRGSGAYVYDVDDNRYIDYVGSYGPLILGHAPQGVAQAIIDATAKGTTFGATNPKEVALAQRVQQAMPHMESMRMVSSGTEATMSAARLARGATARQRIIKFAGCYHGHADLFLVAETGSGLATLGLPGSAGVPPGAISDTLTVPYNDLRATEALFQQIGDTVAAVIVEPVACNMGLVKPRPGFLKGLRQLCDRFGALLIFDEVITGFRVALGGARERFGVCPDLTTLGKIIGGGLPVGAYGGRKDIMAHVAPLGPVYQAGTLSGNPLAMAAGTATLDALLQPGFYERLEALGHAFEQAMQPVLHKYDHPCRMVREGSIFYLWFCPQATDDPHNYADIKRADSALYQRFFKALLERQISLAPSGFEVGFISAAHSEADLHNTVRAVDESLDVALHAPR